VIDNQMLTLSSVLIFAWIIWALNQNDVDDDNDGPGGGMLQPVHATNS
jgi:hypothetical protein